MNDIATIAMISGGEIFYHDLMLYANFENAIK